MHLLTYVPQYEQSRVRIARTLTGLFRCQVEAFRLPAQGDILSYRRPCCLVTYL